MINLFKVGVLALGLSIAVNAFASPNDTIPNGPLLPKNGVLVTTSSSIIVAKPPNNGHRYYFFAQNPSTNTCRVYLNFGAAAVVPSNSSAGSIELLAASANYYETNFVPNEDVYGIATGANCYITIKYF